MYKSWNDSQIVGTGRRHCEIRVRFLLNNCGKNRFWRESVKVFCFGFREHLFELESCVHPTVMKDMCAECGADLRKDDLTTAASVPMVHSIPELKVSEEVSDLWFIVDLSEVKVKHKAIKILSVERKSTCNYLELVYVYCFSIN